MLANPGGAGPWVARSLEKAAFLPCSPVPGRATGKPPQATAYLTQPQTNPHHSKTRNLTNQTTSAQNLAMNTNHQARPGWPIAVAAIFAAGALHADPVIYEAFAGATGDLNGQAAGTGLTGNWSTSWTINVVSGNLLPGNGVLTSGNHALTDGGGYGQAWADPGTTLSGTGLLAGGVDLWFSALVRSVSNGSTYLSLGTGAADGYDRIGDNDTGSGVGVKLSGGTIQAHGWKGYGIGGGAVRGGQAAISDGVHLVVGKITWGADSSSSATVSIYLPGNDLVLPATATSTITTDMVVDPSTFNTISFVGNGGTAIPEIDEIRFGASYANVTPAAPADNTAPDPSPMTWATPPTGIDEAQITMTATTATDENGMEYYFQCTAGGGHDSIWQASPTYTDTGLTPATEYTYQVKARDLSVSANETLLSDPAIGTTLPADLTPPDPDPMTWATPPVVGSNTAIAMTANTASDPHGVEYFFHCTTPGGHDSAWQASPSYIDVGLTPGTEYTYQVKARDKSLARNETTYSEAAAATTDLLATTVIYEPFVGATGLLNGQAASTTGLSGTWSGNDQINVTAGSLSWGSLATSGNHAVSSGVAQSEWWNVGVGANSGTTLGNAGLLAPGAELWFSCLVKSTSDGSRTYFCLGDTVADGWGRMGDGGGVGFQMDGGTVYAYPGNWAGGWAGPRAAIPDGVNLIVGKITWGPDSSTSGSISIYLPGTDLALPATPASTQSTDVKFDQSTFDTISFAPGWTNSVTPEIDEIRFGGSYETVVVAGTSSGYPGWTSGPFLGTLTDTNPAHDFDGGGLPTGIEWVVKGDPTNGSDDASVTPTLDNTTDVNNFLFVFRRTTAAGGDANTSIAVEYGTDLSVWHNTIDNGEADGVTTSVDPGGFGTGIDKVTVAIPRTLAVGNKLFARLKVVVTP